MPVDRFMADLGSVSPSDLWFNPWRDWIPGIDIRPEAPRQRCAHLRAYLEARMATAAFLLVAEAPGYQGARFSGVAMTCERTLLGGKPEIPSHALFASDVVCRRTSDPAIARNGVERRLGFCEPTATVVWRELVARSGAAMGAVMWNVFPFHPHKPGEPLNWQYCKACSRCSRGGRWRRSARPPAGI